MVKKKFRFILSSAIAFILILAILLSATGCKKKEDPPADEPTIEEPADEPKEEEPEEPEEPSLAENLKYNTESYKTVTKVGYYGEVLGTVERNKPDKEIKNGGLATGYPVYGSSLTSVLGTTAEQNAKRTALIRESSYLTATGTRNAGGGDYTWMDKDGYLYKGTTAEPEATLDAGGAQRRLYQHTASAGMYGGNVSDAEPGIIKKVTMRRRGYTGYGVTGVYAPAGEVIKIEISERDMNLTGGIDIHIGQALYNGKANNIWTAKNQMQRFPVILNTMSVNKNTATFDENTRVYTAYVGSFLGGPLYIRNEGCDFTAIISGGVAYSHFILGYTTEEEFNQNAKSSAPYFDLEVWNFGVLHSGPKRQASGLSYSDIYKAAVLWDKVASVTTTNSSQGIVFLYDPFVAAGAAVAFPGQGSVNCPEGWMRSSLSYGALVTSGAWGNFHEYHHNFQGYGVGNGGEVTNNGMTLVSYSLFTKISSKRGLSNFGGQGLGGWNLYTSAPWALQETLKISRGQTPGNGNQGLALYATLLHNFGPDAYIQAKVRQQSMGYGESYTGYLRAWQDVTHNDMTYFFKDLLKGIDSTVANQYADSDYSAFVPVSSVYQTGRSYMYDGQKKYITTMQPYAIPYGEQFTVDLREYDYNTSSNQYNFGSIILPDGFSYTVKNISQPENGTVAETDTPLVYTYTPDRGSMRSGKIILTLGITKDDDPSFTVDDVDLVLEFEQSMEMNKTTLERTTYTYTEDTKYTDAETAFENNFAGYETVTEQDHYNPVQNVNTDIWLRPNTDSYHQQFPNEPDKYFVHDNYIEVVDGKLYFEETGKYRIYLRGRLNCAVYFSVDGENYTVGATIKDTSAPSNSQYFRPNSENSYFDIEIGESSCVVTTYTGGEEKTYRFERGGLKWLYFKEVLIEQSTPSVSYIGLGLRQWTTPMFTMVEKYYDINGNELESADDSKFAYSVTHYYDYQGHEVTESEANNASLIAPVIRNANDQPYVNAYRSSYEFSSNSDFETDYFYTRTYSYDYTDNRLQNTDQTIVSSKYSPATSSSWGGYPFTENKLVDGNKNTWIHTSGGVSASSPLEFVIDMGSVKPVNRMSIYSQSRRDLQVPVGYTLYGSLDGEEFFTVYEETNGTASATVTVNFPETAFRFYKLVVTRSSGGYVILSEIEMWRVNEVLGGNHITPDSAMFTYEGEWQGVQANSTFGHVYLGEEDAAMSFEFTGTRVGFLASSAYESNFEVYIDGEKVDSVALKQDGAPNPMAYLSTALEQGTHTVQFKCTGEATVDSVVVFP